MDFVRLGTDRFQHELRNGLVIEIKESGTAYRVFVVGMPNTESETRNKGTLGLVEAKKRAALLAKIYEHNTPREIATTEEGKD